MSKLLLVEQAEQLHVRQVQAAIPKDAATAELQIDGPFGLQSVRVIGCLTNLGNGYLYYLVCDQCDGRYLSLYRKDFGRYACRKCLGLYYASSMKRTVQ